MEWVFTSALMVPIAPEIATPMQKIRLHNDRAFERWPPHINLLFPFVLDDSGSPGGSSASRAGPSQFDAKCQEIQQRMSGEEGIEAFTMWFGKLGAFSQGKGQQTVHLVPSTDPPEALTKVYELLLSVCPDYPEKKTFSPHFTIGQWPVTTSLQAIEQSYKQEFSEVLNVPFRVSSILAISRSGTTPFIPRHALVFKVNPSFSVDIALTIPSALIFSPESAESILTSSTSTAAATSSSTAAATSSSFSTSTAAATSSSFSTSSSTAAATSSSFSTAAATSSSFSTAAATSSSFSTAAATSCASNSESIFSLYEKKCLIQIEFPASSLPLENKRVVLVCDTSGSMDGAPRRQVLETVGILQERRLEFEIISYSDQAKLIAGSVEALKANWFSSGTCFRKAFAQMIAYCRRHFDQSIEFVFLTDGQATDSPTDANTGDECTSPNLQQLREFIKQTCKSDQREITIHTFGLGGYSDMRILEQLRLLGSTEGVYCFASAKQGSEIVSEMTDVMQFAAGTSTYTVTLDGQEEEEEEEEVVVVVDEEVKQQHHHHHHDHVLLKKKKKNNNKKQQEQQVLFSKHQQGNIVGTLWADLKPQRITVLDPKSQQQLKIGKLTVVPVTTSTHQYHLALVRQLVHELEDPEQLLLLHDRLERIRASCRRFERTEVFAECLEISAEIDQVRTLHMAKLKGDLIGDSEILSRINALSFKGKMSKARRNRTMDARALANRQLLISLDSRLEALALPPAEELVGLDPQLRDDISHDSLEDILQLSKENMLMIGLRVKRDELAIDQPVCIHVELCNTMLSWTTLESAAQYEITRGNATATGTFDIGSVSRLLTGASNETINAGLPVFGSETHYQRVRVWLPVICGHFFTLSESGFAPKQVPALFAVLARLHRGAKSERANFFVSQFAQLCTRIANDSELLDELRVPLEIRPLNILHRFVSNPHSHEKSELPTLDILYGCMLCLKDQLPACLPRILLAEVLRRQLNKQMVDRSGGPDIFTAITRKYALGSCPLHFPVSVEEPASFDSQTQVFTRAKFVAYQPLTVGEVHYSDEDLDSLEIPKSASEFADKYRIPGWQLSEDQYALCVHVSLLQSAWACHNDRYRALIEAGTVFLDPLDLERVTNFKTFIVSHFDNIRRLHWANGCSEQEDQEIAITLVHDCSITQFVAALRVLGISRGQKVWQEIADQISIEDTWSTIPDNVHKLALMLFGSYLGETLIEGTWMAGATLGAFIRAKLAHTEYAPRIDELDQSSQQHEYRPSDLPNRHGHHKSFPLWVDNPLHPEVVRLIRKWDH